MNCTVWYVNYISVTLHTPAYSMHVHTPVLSVQFSGFGILLC